MREGAAQLLHVLTYPVALWLLMCAFVCCAQPGMIYNLEDGRKALRDVFALQLFDNVQVCFRVLCFASAAQSLFQHLLELGV